LHRASAC